MFSTVGRYDTCGSIISTVGDAQYRGGTQITKDDISLGTEHPYSAQKIPHSTLFQIEDTRFHVSNSVFLRQNPQ